MIAKQFIVLFLLLTLSFAGHQPPGAWILCMEKCTGVSATVAGFTSGWGGLIFGSACYILCGPLRSLVSCFELNTFIETPSGSILITNLRKGDIILTFEGREDRIT